MSRDMLDLFRAVVPVVHATELESVPLIGMCVFNDCHYIAYHLVTLGFQYKARLPEPLRSTATFVDLVPMFRRLGERQYRAVMVRKYREWEVGSGSGCLGVYFGVFLVYLWFFLLDFWTFLMHFSFTLLDILCHFMPFYDTFVSFYTT